MMNAPRFSAIVAFSILWSPCAWAQCPTIGDGFEAVGAGVTVNVVRDISLQDQRNYCSGPSPGVTAPWECTANDSGIAPGFVLGTDAAGDTYDVGYPAPMDFDPSRRGCLVERLDRSGVSEGILRIIWQKFLPSGGTWTFATSSKIQFDVTNGRL